MSSRILNCYTQHLERGVDYSGHWRLRFIIGMEGATTHAAVILHQGQGRTNPEFEACLVDAFCSLRFPPPEESPILVTYPLHVDFAY